MKEKHYQSFLRLIKLAIFLSTAIWVIRALWKHPL
jgi:hypothetical protein